MKRVNIRNLVIQADLDTGDLQEVQNFIEAINVLLQERFPDEQPQIMASGLDNSDLEYEEEIVGREAQIEYVNKRVEKQGDLPLGPDDLYLEHGTVYIKAISKGGVIDDDGERIEFADMSDEEIKDMFELVRDFIEEEDFTSEDAIRIIGKVRAYIEKNGDITLSERGQQMKVTNGNDVIMITVHAVHLNDEQDSEIELQNLHQDDLIDLEALIEELEADDEKTEKRLDS